MVAHFAEAERYSLNGNVALLMRGRYRDHDKRSLMPVTDHQTP